jgi:hypothetical protein
MALVLIWGTNAVAQGFDMPPPAPDPCRRALENAASTDKGSESSRIAAPSRHAYGLLSPCSQPRLVAILRLFDLVDLAAVAIPLIRADAPFRRNGASCMQKAGLSAGRRRRLTKSLELGFDRQLHFIAYAGQQKVCAVVGPLQRRVAVETHNVTSPRYLARLIESGIDH